VHRATQLVYHAKIRAAIDEADTFVDKVEALLDVIHRTLREDPEQPIFASVARDEARRHQELREIAEDPLFPNLFAELIQCGVDTRVIAKNDTVEAQGAVAAVALGLAMLATDMSVDTHALVTDGAKRMLTGTLLREPSVRAVPPSGRRKRRPLPANDEPIAAWR
jgi:hypothetical protein